MKRAFDICISSAILVVTSPLLLAVAIGVKLSSPGPVFFHQVRLGRHAQEFTVTKFRSMTTDTEQPTTASAEPEDEDPDLPLHELRNKKNESGRITSFGALLRKRRDRRDPSVHQRLQGRHLSVVGPPRFRSSRASPASRAGLGVAFEVRPGITGLLAGVVRPQRPHTQRPHPTPRLSLRGLVVPVVGPSRSCSRPPKQWRGVPGKLTEGPQPTRPSSLSRNRRSRTSSQQAFESPCSCGHHPSARHSGGDPIRPGVRIGTNSPRPERSDSARRHDDKHP